MSTTTQQKIEVMKAADYRTINVDGIIGGAKTRYFEIVCFTDEGDYREATNSPLPVMEKAILKRTLQCRLVVDPMMAKIIHGWLGNQILLYEKSVGKIPTQVPQTVPSKDRMVS